MGTRATRMAFQSRVRKGGGGGEEKSRERKLESMRLEPRNRQHQPCRPYRSGGRGTVGLTSSLWP
jgi:hypothetical protein